MSFMFFSESCCVKATMLLRVSSRRGAAASVNPAQRGSNTFVAHRIKKAGKREGKKNDAPPCNAQLHGMMPNSAVNTNRRGRGKKTTK